VVRGGGLGGWRGRGGVEAAELAEGGAVSGGVWVCGGGKGVSWLVGVSLGWIVVWGGW
jgi:hypothetical protein